MVVKTDWTNGDIVEATHMNDVGTQLNTNTTEINTHKSAVNPHAIDKTTVGLSNVDNTSDGNKPVSTAQATAIGTVQSNLDAHAGAVNPHNISKTTVGLGNVSDLAPADLPISNATQTAINTLNSGVNNFHVTTNVGNNYSITPSPAITSYADGLTYKIRINADSTDVTTLNVNGLGAIAIKTASADSVKDLKNNGVYTVVYCAGVFIIQGGTGTGSSGAWVKIGDIVTTVPQSLVSMNVPSGYVDFNLIVEGAQPQSSTGPLLLTFNSCRVNDGGTSCAYMNSYATNGYPDYAGSLSMISLGVTSWSLGTKQSCDIQINNSIRGGGTKTHGHYAYDTSVAGFLVQHSGIWLSNAPITSIHLQNFNNTPYNPGFSMVLYGRD
jgi:hypothetical protein